MNTASATPLRYVVAPAVAQLYEEDKEGFDAVTDEPVLAKLSNENDMVTGQESIYGYILNKHADVTPSMDSVSGNEGFFGTLKKGASSLIKTVKDFFKWIWSFFGSKQKIMENRAEDIAKQIDKNGAKDGEVPYPKSVSSIYPKQGKPENNLNWLGTAVDNAAKAIDKTIKYADLLKAMAKSTGEALVKEGGEKTFGSLNEDFKEDLAKIFGVGVTKNSTMNLLTIGDLIYRDGRFSSMGSITAIRAAQGSVFHTSTSQVQGYIKEYHALEGKLDTMMKNIHELETSIVKMLENHLIVAGALTKRDDVHKHLVEDTKTIVRAAMANIKVLQTAIFRSAKAVLDILSAATK